MATAIKVDDICKDYATTQVLKNVSLQVETGDFLTVLGPSGAGKTTLLKMIAGFEEPTSGTIELDGRDISRLPIHKRNIGMLFQNYALFPHLTVYENIEFPLKTRKIPKDERKKQIGSILERVRMEQYAARYPRELSGGQQQRVALARALVFNPSILLLDEPMAALDKQLRKQMQLEVKELHRDMGITTISVTHDQEEALTMATKVCVMRDGMIEQLSSPTDIYERPVSVFCAKFIGEANVLECEVSDAEGWDSLTLDVHGNTITIPSNKRKYAKRDIVPLVIRPEKVHVLEPGGSFDGIRLTGTVEQAVYVGDIWKLKVRLGNGRSIKVKTFTSFSRLYDSGNAITLGVGLQDIILVNNTL
jgi:putative spermidine/putrescine transport system ATP-binding protein